MRELVKVVDRTLKTWSGLMLLELREKDQDRRKEEMKWDGSRQDIRSVSHFPTAVGQWVVYSLDISNSGF